MAIGDFNAGDSGGSIRAKLNAVIGWVDGLLSGATSGKVLVAANNNLPALRDDIGSRNSYEEIIATSSSPSALSEEAHHNLVSGSGSGSAVLTMLPPSGELEGFMKRILVDGLDALTGINLDITNIINSDGSDVDDITFTAANDFLLLEAYGGLWRVVRATSGVVTPEV
jgi:hypothetical protein